MSRQDEAIYASLENCQELAMMLKQLPREERLRVEGIIIGVGLRCTESSTAAQNSA